MPGKGFSQTYAPPSLQDGMEWCDDVAAAHNRSYRVLMESYRDSQNRQYTCVALQVWSGRRGDSFTGWRAVEMRVYESTRTSIGAVLITLAHRLDAELNAAERAAEKQAHF